MSMFRRRLMIALGSNGKYFKFADAEVNRVLASAIGDGIGVLADKIHTVGNGRFSFKNNKIIETFEEFEMFTGINNIIGPNGNYDGLFASATNLKKIKCPQSTAYISGYSFYNCNNLEYFVIPKSVKNIEESAFYGCSNFIGEIDLPNIEGVLQDKAFGKSGITKVKGLGKITVIKSAYNAESGPFRECKLLKLVILPDTLKEIQTISFISCTELKCIILNSVVPPTLGNEVFLSSNKIKIYVPDQSVETYKTATNWSNYADRIHPISEYVPGEEDV